MAEYTDQKRESKHIVAILDLLGASEMIMGPRSEHVLNMISNLFDKAGSDWVWLEKTPISLILLKTVTFSDNIAFALELPEDPADLDETEAMIKDFIRYISAVQSIALKRRLLFRGGIAIGPLYMNSTENFVWGRALVEAHRLEEKTAIYPRVVLSRQFEAYDLSTIPKIRKDFDGIYFVDYLSIVKRKFPELADRLQRLIQSKYQEAARQEADGKWGHEAILQKYGWLQHYIEQCE